jgi:hypothetical protein
MTASSSVPPESISATARAALLFFVALFVGVVIYPKQVTWKD